MNRSKEELDLSSYFLEVMMGQSSFEGVDKEAVSRIVQGVNKEDIDLFMEATDRSQLSDLRASIRLFVSNYLNFRDHTESGNPKAAEAERIANEMLAETNAMIKSIPDPRVQEAVARSVSIIADHHADILNASSANKKRLQQKLKIGCATVAILAGLGSLGLLVSGFTIPGLVSLGVGGIACLIFALMERERRKKKEKLRKQSPFRDQDLLSDQLQPLSNKEKSFVWNNSITRAENS